MTQKPVTPVADKKKRPKEPVEWPHERAAIILSRALAELSIKYTNRGYRYQELITGDQKLCAFAAINEANADLFITQLRDTDPVVQLLQEVALDEYGCSFVTVNDDMDAKHIFKCFALAIERAMTYASRYYRHVERIEPRAHPTYPRCDPYEKAGNKIRVQREASY